MYKPLFRALQIAGVAILLVSSACDDGGSTSTISDAAQSRSSDEARFAGTNTATLELRGVDGSLQAITLSRSHFNLTMREEKADGVSKHGAQGRLFMLRNAATARGISSRERQFSFQDRWGHRHSLRIQRSLGNGPISKIDHYRDGTLMARSARSWRSVRGGWIATGSTLEVIRDGEVVSRVNSSVRTTELATSGSAATGINRLLALANALRPAALLAQNFNRCRSQIAEYGDAYAEFAILVGRIVAPPMVGDNFRQIGDAYERYEEATSELQRCLMLPAR